MHTITLSLEEIVGSHMGAKMAQVLLKTCDKWGIVHDLRYIVTDNLSSNNFIMAELAANKLFCYFCDINVDFM